MQNSAYIKREGSGSRAGLNSSFSTKGNHTSLSLSLCPHERCVRALRLDSSASDVARLKKKKKNRRWFFFFLPHQLLKTSPPHPLSLNFHTWPPGAHCSRSLTHLARGDWLKHKHQRQTFDLVCVLFERASDLIQQPTIWQTFWLLKRPIISHCVRH